MTNKQYMNYLNNIEKKSFIKEFFIGVLYWVLMFSFIIIIFK